MIISKKVLSILVIITAGLGAVVGFKVLGTDDGPVDVVERQAEVALASVGALNNTLPSLPTVGTVESKTQVTLRAETSGEVRGVYAAQGQFVSAGTLIAELGNSTERARLLQAEAGVESAQAALSKIQAGARGEDITILATQVAREKQGLIDTISFVVGTLNTVFSNIEGVVLGNVDQMFSNARGTQPQLSFTTTANNRVELEWGRVLIGEVLTGWSVEINQVTTESNLDVALQNADVVVAEVRSFVTQLASALNNVQPHAQLSPTTIAGWKTAMVTAQGSITGSMNSLSASRDRLTAQRAALAIAEEQLSRAKSGERSEDIIAAEARVKQAEASLSEARTLFAKTQLRTPISGTVNEISIERGDFVSAFSDVAVVSNNNALQITTYITENERPFISVGSSVVIDGQYEGVVATIAPALDSQTKKIEVIVGITGNAPFTNGESVRLSIQRDSKQIVAKDVEITLPLSSLKIRPHDTVVFTVSADNTLVAHPVILGPIVGDRVVIRTGVTSDMEIVLDARGLREGDIVTSVIE